MTLLLKPSKVSNWKESTLKQKCRDLLSSFAFSLSLSLSITLKGKAKI